MSGTRSFPEGLRKVRWRGPVVAGVCFTVASCITTEEVERPPTVNVAAVGDVGPRPGRAGGGTLGVEVEANESDSLERLEALPGVRVATVAPGGPGDRAGLRGGDVILSVDGVASNSKDAFDTMVRGAEAGSVLALEVRRDTRVLLMRPEVRSLSAAIPVEETYHADPVRLRAGFRSVTVTRRGEPALVAEVVRIFPKSPLPAAGIGLGARLAALDGRPLEAASDLVRRLLDEHDFGERVELTVLRGDREEVVDVRLWTPRRRLTRLAVPILFTYEWSLDPSRTRFRLLDLWLVSLFGYEREDSETEYSLLTFFRFGTGFGELVEEE